MEPAVVFCLISKPLEVVWERWTDPDLVWLQAAPDSGWYPVEAMVDVREGGTFSILLQQTESGQQVLYSGTFTKVIPGQLVEWMFEDGRMSTVEFQQIDQSTIVRRSFDPERTPSAESQIVLNQAILNHFKDYVETL